MSSKCEAFSLRLKEAMDDAGVPKRGRQMLLSKEFEVSQPSAKRWLDGNNYPDIDKVIEIANKYNCSVEWLLTGRGLKHPIDLELSDEFKTALEVLMGLSQEQRTIALKILEVLKNTQE